ncbi:MAG: LamG domain-containing protein [Bdellovibrionaceae bacterium]|nr:LamG domain-containing protein [Pseudobdellovibrionaceae bacterium]
MRSLLRRALAPAALLILLAACTGNPLGDGKAGSELGADYQPGLPGTPAPPTPGSQLWNFLNAADYIYDADAINVGGGKAVLKTVDLVHTGTDFSPASGHAGTQYTGGLLKLHSSSSDTSLAASWTPKFSSLVGYWKMDNDAWADSSGKGHNGTAGGNAAFIASGMVGSHAGAFDGTGDKVTTNSFVTDLPSNKFTYTAWVRPDAINTTYTVVGWSANDGPALTLENTGLLRLSMQNGTVIGTSNASKPLAGANIWHHVAVTYDATGAYALYINGENVGSGTSLQTFAISDLVIGMKAAGTSNEFKGRIDDLAVFSTPLSAGDISLIYHRQKQKYSGMYTSPVFDMGGETPWEHLKIITTRPYGKELPGVSGSELAADYDNADTTLMAGLVGLWHLNEVPTGAADEIKDSSGLGHHGTNFNAQSVTTGRFGRALKFNANNDRVVVADHDDFDNTDKLTISVWVHPTDLTGTRGVISKRVSGSSEAAWGIYFASGALTIDIDGINNRFAANKTFAVGNWYHVVIVYDGTKTQTQRVSVYVDGALDKVAEEASAAIPNTASDLQIGRLGGSASLIGTLDEVAIWRRALTLTDVQSLYRRGANRLLYQVRSCDDAACDTETWMGPDGKDTSHFSELHNWSAISATGEGSGSVRQGGLELDFGDFSAAGLSIPDNRFFQYRILMGSDEGIAQPDVKTMVVDSGTRYRAGSPSIENRFSVAATALNSLLLNSGGACTPTYQLSKDGTDFYYWNSSAWVLATMGTLQSNDAADVQANFNDFALAPLSGTQFFFRVYLNSDTTQSCELNSVLLDYSP